MYQKNYVKLQEAFTIQNYRDAKNRKCQIKTKLHLGYNRNRLEGGQCDF